MQTFFKNYTCQRVLNAQTMVRDVVIYSLRTALIKYVQCVAMLVPYSG